MANILRALGGRKVFFGLLFILVGVLVDNLTERGLSANLLQLFQFITVAFFAGNSLEHVSQMTKQSSDPSGPIKEISTKMEEIERLVADTQGAVQVSNHALSQIMTSLYQPTTRGDK